MNLDIQAFEALETRLGAAHRNEEALYFAEAARLLGGSEAFDDLCAAHAYADAAIRFHRALLPPHGYHFGETAARKGIASSWRRGDAHALPFEAATPGLALLRAAIYAAARQARREARAACGICGGLGWTITRHGGKRMCRHTVRA